MMYYLFLSYFFVALVKTIIYMLSDEDEVTVIDIIIFILSPFAMIPIIVIGVLSRLVDLNKPILKKNSNTF
jgi:hypothetical protein